MQLTATPKPGSSHAFSGRRVQAALPDRRPSAARLPRAGGRRGGPPRRGTERGRQRRVAAWAAASRPAGHRCRLFAVSLTVPTRRHCTGVVGEMTHASYFFGFGGVGRREKQAVFPPRGILAHLLPENSTNQSEYARWLGATPRPMPSTSVHVL